MVCLGITPVWAATITLQPGASAGKDALLTDYTPDINYGDNDNMMRSALYSNEKIKGLIQFDLTSIPSSATILSADLSLYHASIVANQTDNPTFSFYRITESWAEDSVTWNNQPNYNGTAVASLTISDDNITVWRTWDVTSIVQDWYSGTYDNYGLVLALDSGKYGPTLVSSDYSLSSAYHPKLTINYVPIPGAVWLLGSCLIGLAGLRKTR